MIFLPELPPSASDFVPAARQEITSVWLKNKNYFRNHKDTEKLFDYLEPDRIPYWIQHDWSHVNFLTKNLLLGQRAKILEAAVFGVELLPRAICFGGIAKATARKITLKAWNFIFVNFVRLSTTYCAVSWKLLTFISAMSYHCRAVKQKKETCSVILFLGQHYH